MFNWWTFFFQLINFFIVLYILYRLFFNPLKRIIQTREEMIAKRLQKLEMDEIRVKEDESHYREALQEIQNLRKKEIEEVRKQALIENDLLMKETEKEIAKAYEKQNSINEQLREKSEKEIRQKSIDFSIHYSEKLLTELSDPLLHQKRIEQFLLSLQEKEVKEITQLKKDLSSKGCDILLYTPFQLHNIALENLKETLKKLIGCTVVQVQSILDPSLIAGIRLTISNKVFDCSLKEELKRFKERMEKEL